MIKAGCNNVIQFAGFRMVHQRHVDFYQAGYRKNGKMLCGNYDEDD